MRHLKINVYLKAEHEPMRGINNFMDILGTIELLYAVLCNRVVEVINIESCEYEIRIKNFSFIKEYVLEL